MSVGMESWMIEHRVFVFETFIQTGSSVVFTQRDFVLTSMLVDMAPFRLETQY
jgi:hypothetical protein